MNISYTQKISSDQKASVSKADSVLDVSAQSESLQRKAELANNAAQCASLPPRPNNTGMPDNLKTGIESLSGFSMDNVRVHYNSSKPATVQALAYTQGTDIHVAPGQEKCLPHEAWYVAQQMAGRVSPTTNINGMPVNDNAALEHEADVMGEKAVQCKKKCEKKDRTDSVCGNVFQLMPGENVDLVCSANIWYEDKRKQLGKVKGVGFNNPFDASDVLEMFSSYGLQNLADGTYAKTNPAGQCAEPHAVANALKKIPHENVDLKEGDESYIKKIYVSKAVLRKYEGKGENPYSTQPDEDSSKVDVYAPCETCKEWIDNDGFVKSNYLKVSPHKKVGGKLSQKERTVSDRNSNPSSETTTEGTAESGFYQTFLYKPWKGINLEELSKLDLSAYFHNVHFLEIIRSEGRFDWFVLDPEAMNIDLKKGLLTVIKKQMLKNRAFELRKPNLKERSYDEKLENLEKCEKAFIEAKSIEKNKCMAVSKILGECGLKEKFDEIQNNREANDEEFYSNYEIDVDQLKLLEKKVLLNPYMCRQLSQYLEPQKDKYSDMLKKLETSPCTLENIELENLDSLSNMPIALKNMLPTKINEKIDAWEMAYSNAKEKLEIRKTRKSECDNAYCEWIKCVNNDSDYKDLCAKIDQIADAEKALRNHDKMIRFHHNAELNEGFI